MAETKTGETIRFDIFIAGDLVQIKLCVTVEPVTFIYTGGAEDGARIGLINYPRFPQTVDELKFTAVGLAEMLLAVCCQHSYSIVGPDKTEWFSRRPA